MFVAENDEKQIVLANDYQRGQEEKLYCPSCAGEVIFKQGKWLLPHFAHRTLDDCQSFSEGETLEHLKGKSLLHQWTKTSQLEAYLPALKQRPDLLWGKLAIEFQCSTLPFERFLERTKNYLQHDYLPWWLLGEQRQPKQRFGALQKACCYYQKEQGLKLWTMNVAQREIQLYHQIDWHFNQTHEYQINSFSIEEYSLKEVIRHRLPSKSSKPWSTFQFKQRLRQKLFQQDKKIMQLQERFYLQGGHLLYLPSAYYQRSPYFFFFEEELLYLRFCFQRIPSFSEWYQKILTTYDFWPYPFVSQGEILQGIYLECLELFPEKRISL